ncbi:MAG TPA: ABC transporter permease [Thermoanaerobaculia bacterium]|jgi:predicted permease|nr:ABC transporter permease [Thermoanaerobaculia bacterium]
MPFRDLRLVLRALRRAKGYALATVACFALGSGAYCTVFTIVDATLIRELPYRDPGRLVMISNRFPDRGLLREPLSELELLDVRRSTALESVAGLLHWRFNLTGMPEPEQLVGARASAALFPLLGVTTAAGRTFSAEEETPGRDRVALLSHRLWQRRFGGDRRIVGRSLILNNEPHQVVGVLPADFRFGGDEIDVWAPLAIDVEKPLPRDARGVTTVGRLRRGRSQAQAQAEMDVLAHGLQRQYPAIYPAGSGWALRLTPLRDHLVGAARPALLALLAAGGLVLLTACGNVINLTLARATERSRELALRAALGAGRGALTRPLLAESTVLTLAGGTLGLLLASWVVRTIVALGPEGIPRLHEIAVDRTVIGITLIFSLAGGLALGGLATAWALRHGGNDALKEGGERAAAGRGGLRIRNLLVAAQVALAVLVLVGAGLLARSFLRLRQVDVGFRSDHLLTFQIFLPRSSFKEPATTVSFFDGLLGNLAALPGVRAAAAVSDLPFSGSDMSGQVAVEGTAPPRPGDANPAVSWRVVTPGYFDAMGIPLRQGRLFRSADDAAGAAVVIVDSRLARRLWQTQSPLGRRVSLRDWAKTDWMTVVGVVGPVKHNSLAADSLEQLYLPQAQSGWRMMSVVARTRGDPMQLAGTVRGLVWKRAPDVPLVNVRSMDQLVAESTSQLGFGLWLFAIFSALAVVLAALGVYSVTAYAVVRRSREIAIRMSCGANRRDIARLVLWQSALQIWSGLALGLLLVLWGGNLLQSQLFEVVPYDPATLFAVSALICGVGVAASYLPARRATRITPAQALGQT